jgi:hypothetical protein
LTKQHSDGRLAPPLGPSQRRDESRLSTIADRNRMAQDLMRVFGYVKTILEVVLAQA